MPMATHGAIACAFHCLGAAGTVRDVPHSWHARDPGLTLAPQDGQVDTMGVPQWLQKLPAAGLPQPGHWTDLAFMVAPYHKYFLFLDWID
jgi:hypothetical protein